MNQREFDRQIDRLRNHFGERHYSSELTGMFWQEFQNLPNGSFTKVISEAIATLSQARPPLRDDLRRLIAESGVKYSSSWKYVEVADCLHCGGCGWYWAIRGNGAQVVVICEDCAAGKNLLNGPKGTHKAVLKEFPINTAWLKPGRGHYEHTEMHPRLKERLVKLGVRDIASLVTEKLNQRVPGRETPNDANREDSRGAIRDAKVYIRKDSP